MSIYSFIQSITTQYVNEFSSDLSHRRKLIGKVIRYCNCFEVMLLIKCSNYYNESNIVTLNVAIYLLIWPKLKS